MAADVGMQGRIYGGVDSEQRRAEYRVYHRKDVAGRASARPTGSDRGVLTLIPTNRLRLIACDEWTADARQPADL